MFQELMPLLSTRSLVLTLTKAEDDILRVTVTPRTVGKDDAKALTTPFVVEGTAAELDADLPGALIAYTGQHMTTERALASVQAALDQELAEAKAEAARKTAEAKKSPSKPAGGTKTPAAKAADEPQQPKEESSPTMSLFGSPEPEPDPSGPDGSKPSPSDQAGENDSEAKTKTLDDTDHDESVAKQPVALNAAAQLGDLDEEEFLLKGLYDDAADYQAA